MQLFLAKLLLLLSLLMTMGSARAEDGSIDIRTFGVDASELRDFLGLDIYKFVFKQKVGDEFDLVLRQYDAAGDQPREFFRGSFTVTQTQPARGNDPKRGEASDISLSVCFLKKDHTIGSALLSNDKEVMLRIESRDCRGDLSTNVALPLADVKQKTLIHRVNAQTARPDNADGTAMLVLYANSDQSGSLKYPYAELAVVPKQ